MMGGIRVDARGESSIPGLFAVGEASGGAHGAHRLAAGGGFEVVAGGALVGEAAAVTALESAGDRAYRGEPRPELLSSKLPAEYNADVTVIRESLDAGCGILRSRSELEEAMAAIEAVHDRHREQDGQPFVRRAAAIASTIARSANMREESRGDHFRTDFPEMLEEWRANVVVSKSGDDLAFGVLPCPAPTPVA
jgi:aspartate oxidase